MGCDIHGAIEYKKGESWYSLCVGLSLSRSYQIFARLAGVRGYGKPPPTVPPRGFPEDADYFTKLDRDGEAGGAHSETWLSLEEWDAATKDAGADYSAITAAMRALASEYPVRVVLWFDN